ncbi:GAF domain-containing protein [Williamsia soli]|uniref:GAF domain-containing protein n=1 Tax=Williamsia soli TaxID=364929 RepID=UPI001A9DAD50|nr:GAF domain-containing protein [Williamsia soli]
MTRDLHTSREHPLTADEVLQEVTEASVALLPSVTHAGITVITETGHGHEAVLKSVLASDPVPTHADALQQEHGEGPGLDAIWEQYAVRINNVETERRWPKLMLALFNETSIRSVLSFQLYTNGPEVGVLTFYAEVPDAFDEDTEDLAVDLATHAAIALTAARKGKQG